VAQVGLKDLHFAILTNDSKEYLSYEKPESLIGAINATINPTVNTQELYADDQLWESVSALGKIDVEIETADLTLPIRAKLGGHTIENGVLIEKSTDLAPHIALGFKSLKSNGKYRFVWLLKGVAQPMAEDYATKKDNVEHKTPKLKLTFMPRAYDGEWKRTAGEVKTVKIILRLDGNEKVFVTDFISARMMRRTIEISKNMNFEEMSVDDLDVMVEYLVQLFGKQFTIDEVYDGLPSKELVPILIQCINEVVGDMATITSGIGDEKNG